MSEKRLMQADRHPLGSPTEIYQLASRNCSWQRKASLGERLRSEAWTRGLEQGGELKVSGPTIPLPAPTETGHLDLYQAITQRRSVRTFSADPLALEDLATLLFLGVGHRRGKRPGDPSPARNVPSAGNLGSVEIFALLDRVATVASGVYHYRARSHELVQMDRSPPLGWLLDEGLYQPELSSAAAALVLSCRYARVGAKYGHRGYLLGTLDVGHVSENINLAATSLGLGACVVSGFVEEKVDRRLQLDGLDHASVLLVVVGSTDDHREGNGVRP